MKKTLLFFSSLATLSLLSFCVMAQNKNFQYETVPANFLKNFNVTNRTATYNSLLKKAYSLEKSLPKDYVRDGSVDYTNYLQQGIDSHTDVVFPDFPVLVNTTGLSLKSNSNVLFKPGSELRLKPNDQTSYNILKIFNVEHLNLYYAVVKGDRDQHGGDVKSQWGMGISIKDSHDVKLINPKVTNCWGDGIYIGNAGKNTNTDIIIENAWLDYNRRNGISIVCGTNVRLISPVISNTSGHMPMSGIDIEPNINDDEIRSIVIDNALTFNNSMHGIVLSLGGLMGTEKKQVQIDINNHRDEHSNLGFGLSLTRKKSLDAGPPMAGLIKVSNPVWNNNVKKGFQYYKLPQNGIEVRFIHPAIFKDTSDGKSVTDEQNLNELKQTTQLDPLIKTLD